MQTTLRISAILTLAVLVVAAPGQAAMRNVAGEVTGANYTATGVIMY